MIRIGEGYDVHRLAPDRKLILGGVQIPFEMGLVGHSDADVLLHAICNALLGAAGLGDIGNHFPDNDSHYKNADSRNLLRQVVSLLDAKGFKINNVDSTIVAEQPKLASFIPAMRQVIADDLQIQYDAVNVKATTNEKMGFIGRGEGMAAHAVVLIETISS